MIRKMLCAALLVVVCGSTLYSQPDSKKARKARDTRLSEEGSPALVVLVEGKKGEVRYRIEEQDYSAPELGFQLGELKLQRGKNCQVSIIYDDSLPFQDLIKVSKMAIDAGFLDIHSYVHFTKSGNMSEVVFSAVRKYSTKPPVSR